MKRPPLQQQSAALKASNLGEYFAFFMEQGTGKTYVVLSEAESLFLLGRISMLVVIAPNGVQLNWTERECPKHLSVPFRTLVWSPNHTKKYQAECTAFVNHARDSLLVLAFNVEAFSTKRSKAEIFLRNVLKRHRALLNIDESSTIKNHTTAARTRHIISLGALAPYRRIETGTPVETSPFDFYSQAKFLRPGLLMGFLGFTEFKAFFGEWVEKYGQDKRAARAGNLSKPIKYQSLVRYRNLDTLKREVDKFSYAVMKADCLDLPPKQYEVRTVLMTPKQSQLYHDALEHFIVWMGDSRITLSHAFTRLTRLSQILGGFVKRDEDDDAVPVDAVNPKIESLCGYVREMPPGKKLVVWARYRAELIAIAEALGKKHCALYWGDIAPEARHENIDRFMTDPEIRFFVGNPQSGKYGIELFAASHVVYYSNSFSPSARWQSEDRVHRIGQSAESVLYTDLAVPNTLDTKLLRLLAQRTTLAALFKGDKRAMAEWLRAQDDPVRVGESEFSREVSRRLNEELKLNEYEL